MEYGSREVPPEPQKRGRAAAGSRPLEPVAKKAKRGLGLASAGASSVAAITKPPRKPSSKQNVRQAEAQKWKGIRLGKYPFEIAVGDMGSPDFMVALRTIECTVPRGFPGRGRDVHIYIDQTPWVPKYIKLNQ